MPANRTRIRRGLVGGRLNARQRAELLIGPIGDRFGRQGEPGLESDDHARLLWQRHRTELLADRGFNVGDPGYRPHGFWKFEVALKRHAFGWRWPRGCRDEVATVYRYHADEAERDAIEARWRLVPASAPPWWRRKHRVAA